MSDLALERMFEVRVLTYLVIFYQNMRIGEKNLYEIKGNRSLRLRKDKKLSLDHNFDSNTVKNVVFFYSKDKKHVSVTTCKLE